MRTVFIVNPKAGKGRGREKFIKEIEAASKKTGVAVEVYSTRAVGDGEALAAQLAREAEARGEETRIIACGGDGTLNEVLNGAMRHDHVAIGVVPIGTGNDFCRNFPEAGDIIVSLCLMLLLNASVLRLTPVVFSHDGIILKIL